MSNILTLNKNGTIVKDLGTYAVDTMLVYKNDKLFNHLGYSIFDFKTVLDTIAAPTIISPVNNAVDYNDKISISSIAYSTGLNFLVHDYTDWEVATDINFTTLVDSSYKDALNKLSYEPGNVLPGITYYVRSRQYATGIQSPWSLPLTYTTPASILAKPTLVADNTGDTITLLATAFAVDGSVETHASTDWELAIDANFSNVVFSSLGNTIDLTNITIADTLLSGQIYYARVKYNTTSFTSLYGTTNFKISNRSVQPTYTLGASVIEGGYLEGTINSYDPNIVYNVYTDKGIITYQGGSTFIFQAPIGISTQTISNISIVANSIEKIPSIPITVPVTVTVVTAVADAVLTNSTFNLNASSSVGFTL